MKKTFLSLAFCAAALCANATIVVDETFADFPTGWTASGSVTTPATGGERALEAALTYQDANAAYVHSGVGSAVKTALDASDKYQHTKALPSDVTSDCYVAFLFRADNEQKQSQAQVFGLGAPSLAARLWVGKSSSTDATVKATKCRLGVTRSSGTGADVQWGTAEVNVNETHLIVLKYTMTATDTIASIFVDPAIGGTEPAAAFASDNQMGAGKCKATLKNMTFYTTGNTKSYFTVGGVRVATTWAEAVAGKAAQQEEVTYADALLANFGDSTLWINRLDAAPAEAAFPTDTLNGYVLTSTAVVKSGKTDTIDNKQIKFYARAHMDKKNYNPSIVTPFVQGYTTLYVYGHSGSDTKDVKVETRRANESWQDCQVLTFMRADAVYTVTIPDSVQVRLSNTTNSAIYVYYIGTAHPKDAVGVSLNPSALENVQAEKAVKVIENGQLFIIKNGVRYNALGAKL